MTLSIAVKNTNFGSPEEYVSGVYVNGEKLGGNYLENMGENLQCEKWTKILDKAVLSEKVQTSVTSSAALMVNITTSAAVDCCPCDGFFLFAQVIANWVSNPESPWDKYTSVEENAILQYSAGALQSDRASFFEIPPEAAVFNKLSATISLNSLLSAAGAQSYGAGCQVRTLTHPFVVFFRLSVMVDGRQLHGPQSNPIVVNPLFHPTMLPSYDSSSTGDSAPDGISTVMIAAMWSSYALRVLRITSTLTSDSSSTLEETPVGLFDCRQVLPADICKSMR
jgi:hypothetical protein